MFIVLFFLEGVLIKCVGGKVNVLLVCGFCKWVYLVCDIG